MKLVKNLKKEDFFSEFETEYPNYKEIERTKEIIRLFNSKNGEESTKLYLKSDVMSLTCFFEKFIKVSINEFDINPLYCVSLPGYTLQWGLKYTGIHLETLQEKDLFLLLENKIRGGLSSVMGDRYVDSDDSKRIMFFDANNLYEDLLSRSLP